MRQLVNVIEQCVALTTAPVISEALVTQALQEKTPRYPHLLRQEGILK